MNLRNDKKWLVLFLVCCLGCGVLNGCAKGEGVREDYQQTAESKETSGQGEASDKETAGEESDNQDDSWKKAYAQVLDDLPSKKDFKKNTFCFAIRDIDGDEVPELIQKNGLIITVYTYHDELVKIGRHDFESGTTRLLVSDDSSCPGIFIFSVGGGYEWYEYMTVQDGKLAFEDLWNKDYSGISKILGKKRGKIEKTSSDEKLITESKKAYKKERDLTFKKILPRNYKDLKEED